MLGTFVRIEKFAPDATDLWPRGKRDHLVEPGTISDLSGAIQFFRA
jgi:hypothetical protein